MKIALIGYGKMGHEIEKVARERGHEIVCIIDINDEEKFDSPEFKSADVAIEFTSPQSALHNYRKAFAAGIPVVSGTTGWLQHLDEVKQLCEKEGQTFFYASNFSLGVNIFCGKSLLGRNHESVSRLRCAAGRNASHSQVGCPKRHSHLASGRYSCPHRPKRQVGAQRGSLAP